LRTGKILNSAFTKYFTEEPHEAHSQSSGLSLEAGLWGLGLGLGRNVVLLLEAAYEMVNSGSKE
jgi:hypothetical protein